jgi:hypothetical protein
MSKLVTLVVPMYALFVVSSVITPPLSFQQFQGTWVRSAACIFRFGPVAPHQFYVIEQVPRRTWEPLLIWDFKKYP